MTIEFLKLDSVTHQTSFNPKNNYLKNELFS